MKKIRRQKSPQAKWFFLGVSAIIIFLFWQMVQSYALTLMTAAMFAVLLAPLERWLRGKVKSRHLSAILVTFGFILFIGVPILLLLLLVGQQATELIQGAFGAEGHFADFALNDLAFWNQLPVIAQDYIASIDLVEVTSAAVDWLRANIGALLAGGAEFALQFALFLVFLFYFFIYRESLHKEILALSPFEDGLDEEIVQRIAKTIRNVMFGAVVIAGIQATLASIGMTIFGVPKALLWGAFALIAAQVPMVGMGLIMIPAITYLALTGATGAAIGLTLWGIIVVGLVDNILSPILVGGRTKMPELLVLLAILGGIQQFGPIGFIIGPVILSGLLVARDLYKAGILDK
jgi:predicted PurR-regulated permease PerM